MSVITVLHPTTTDPTADPVSPTQSTQWPQVRGEFQKTRITAGSGAGFVPVDKNGKTFPSAVRTELRPWNNGTLALTATADATGTDTVLTMSSTDIAQLKYEDYFLNVRTNELFRVLDATLTGTTVNVQRALQNYAKNIPVQNGDVYNVVLGDTNDSGGSDPTSRAESYFLHYGAGASGSGVTPDMWPNPPGSIRFYEFSVYIPTGHVFTTAAQNWWFVLFQSKGFRGGSPPFELVINKSNWGIGGTRRDVSPGAGAFTGGGTYKAVETDKWTNVVMGFCYSASDTYGWFEMWIDGVNVQPRMSIATMDTYTSNNVVYPDPQYPKFGQYQTAQWTAAHVVHHSPITVATTREDVGVGTPPVTPSVGSGEYWGQLM